MDFGKPPLSFQANQELPDPSVRYMAHGSGGAMYFTPPEVVLALQSGQLASERQSSCAQGSPGLATPARSEREAGTQETTSVVRLQFIASRP